MGREAEFLGTGRVERIIVGTNRLQGLSFRAQQSLPIKLPILRRIVQQIRRSPAIYVEQGRSAALVACLCHAFACLRIFGLSPDATDPRFDLREDSIDCSGDDVQFT